MKNDTNAASYNRSLSLLDGILLVVGSMIGSGIFIVSADIARSVGSSGWLLLTWVLTGFLTLAAALSYGELSSMFPKAGGQYVYLREAYGRLYGFLYGWAFFAVIQTGTIAAVGVAFAKFAAYIFPSFSETNYLAGGADGFHVTAAQLVSIGVIVLLTFINSLGVQNGKIVQFIFTFAKIAAMVALILFGLFLVKDHALWSANWQNAWDAKKLTWDSVSNSFTTSNLSGSLLLVAVCVAMVGSIFSSDAWNNVTFIAGEIKRPERNIALSLAIGTFIVTLLYVGMNIMYLNVLSVEEIAAAPLDRVALAAAQPIMGEYGTLFIALMIMISTFGCNNGLILSGARVYNTMAKDGLFIAAAKKLNKKGVPATALWMQCIWASVLCLSGKYGQLLDYIVFTALLFYILTISAIFVLRRKMPDHPRPYKAFGYPVIPVLYIVIAATICIVLITNSEKFNTTWPGLLIVALGYPVYRIYEAKEKKKQLNEQSRQ